MCADWSTMHGDLPPSSSVTCARVQSAHTVHTQRPTVPGISGSPSSTAAHSHYEHMKEQSLVLCSNVWYSTALHCTARRTHSRTHRRKVLCSRLRNDLADRRGPPEPTPCTLYCTHVQLSVLCPSTTFCTVPKYDVLYSTHVRRSVVLMALQLNPPAPTGFCFAWVLTWPICQSTQSANSAR
jgi:hypothetical protein